ARGGGRPVPAAHPRPARHFSQARDVGPRRGVRPRPRSGPHRPCQGQGRGPAGDGRLWPWPDVELPGIGRCYRKSDRRLPHAAPAGPLRQRGAMTESARGYPETAFWPRSKKARRFVAQVLVIAAITLALDFVLTATLFSSVKQAMLAAEEGNYRVYIAAPHHHDLAPDLKTTRVWGNILY